MDVDGWVLLQPQLLIEGLEAKVVAPEGTVKAVLIVHELVALGHSLGCPPPQLHHPLLQLHPSHLLALPHQVLPLSVS